MPPDFLFLVHLCPLIKSILFPHTMGIHVCTQVPSSIPNFTGSTDCRQAITYVMLNVLMFLLLSPKTITRHKLGRVGLIWFTLPHCYSSLKTDRTGTEMGQEPRGRSWYRDHRWVLLPHTPVKSAWQAERPGSAHEAKSFTEAHLLEFWPSH